MADNPTPVATQIPNSFYQAPLEVPGYINPSIAPIPSQPVNLYGLLSLIPAKKGKLSTRAKTPYELMMEGTDPYATLMPDQSPIRTNLQTIEPLDDPAGLFHSQDGYGKYGYSSLLNNGDNEDRYSKNFRQDNPDLFFQPGFHPWDGIKKTFYWGGGFLEKTLESGVTKLGQGLGNLYGLTLGNVLDSVTGSKFESFDDWLTKSTDNIISNLFNNWDANLKERYHYFQEKSDRENKGFIQSLGDGDFWMNDVSDGLGFLVSAMFEAGLVSKVGLGTKVASRVAPLAEGVSTEALSGGSMARSGLQRALNAVGIEGSGHTLVKNAVDATSQTLALTAIESAVEAKEAQNKVYQSFEGKVNPETGYTYTNDEKKRLAAAAAGQVFKQNMTILVGPKFLETLVFNRIGNFAKGLMNKSFNEASVEAGKASGSVRSRLGTLSSGTTYNKASALQNIWKVGSTAAIGFVSEGLFEENIQLAASRTAEDIFGGEDEYYRPGTSKEEINRLKSEDELFGSVGNRYLRQTEQFFRGSKDSRFIDDELSKSIGIGGLFGVVGGGIHAGIGIKQQAKIDNYWNNRINGVTKSLFESQNFFQTKVEDRPDPQNPGKTKPVEVVVTNPTTGQPVLDENKLKSFLNKMNNIQGIMDIIANTEDPNDDNNKLYQNKELNKLARNVMFTQLAMEYIRAGKKNLLLSNLSASSQFSDTDIQALGYEPGAMSDQEKKNMLTKMTNIVNRLDKANDWIDNNVLDNVSERREGKLGLAYSKAQKSKRLQEFEAKKAYLRGLAMQNALLDTYIDDINDSEQGLGETVQPIISSTLDENGLPVFDYSTPLHLNAKIPALRNQIKVLEQEFAYHWDNILSRERNSPKGGGFNEFSKSNNGKLLAYSQLKAQETLERINKLQEDLEPLEDEIRSLLKNDSFESFIEDGETFVRSKQIAPTGLEQLENEKIRRTNNIKREEIAIQKGWIEEEWRNTAALKEEKAKSGREETYLSRRMLASRNAYNTFFQREIMDRDNSLGQRKLKLYHSDEAQRVTSKKYTNNESKLLKSVRIQGKVQTIIAEINGKKLIAELNALLERDLPSDEFAVELKRITDIYNGKLMVISQSDKNLVDDQIDNTQDEYNFVQSIFEYMPLDDRFNDKYYDIDINGNYIVKPEYDDLQALGETSNELSNRIDDLDKIKKFLNSIPESVPGDWNNTNLVKKRIADVYTEKSDQIINAYNSLSNNGQSEISGDSLSTKQELDEIENEIDELGQLKVIFEDRDKSDKILLQPEFQGFIASIDERIDKLKKIKELVKERLNSRLKENQDFLIDTVSNLTEQLGLNFDGTTKNEPLKQVIQESAPSDIYEKLIKSLENLKQLIEKEDKDVEDNKAINNAYWQINGQISAIQEIIKVSLKDKVKAEIKKQKKDQLSKIEATALMQSLKSQSYYKDIINNIDDSLLGALQLIFYQTKFSKIGLSGGDVNFLDDQPSSPVYKFREDYNLRKFIRAVEKDESRTPDNTEVSKEDLLEFLNAIKDLQNLEDLYNNINTELNLLDQVEREKQVVQAKIDNKDNTYENLIIPSIQQLFFIRKIANFLRTKTIDSNNPGFRNWIYIQAPGGAGKTQTLGTWFNIISGIPRDRVLATAFTEEASRAIKKALLVGEVGPKDTKEMATAIRELTKNNQFDNDVLIIDEFPAINVGTQKELFEAVSEYTIAKSKAGKGEFKVITMGDTNQLTFSENGSVIPRPSIIINPHIFNNNKSQSNENHPAKMTIIPSLTVNFRSNLFAITSFIDQFKSSSEDYVNASVKVISSDSTLSTPNAKGVVSLEKGEFKTKLVNYIKLSPTSTRTRSLIVNEDKIDEYKKLLTDNGIKVIADPNDEVTNGIYVSTAKNVQGFSFDEVFIDFENKDKVLFSATSSPEYIYNKAMYVAASRARNLIVVTNFPNFENIEDDTITSLENKALEELQVKNSDFIQQRDLEVDGSKSIMGDSYNRSIVNPAPQKAEEKVETPLDQEEDTEEDEEEDEVEEIIEEKEQEKVEEKVEKEQVEEGQEDSQEEEGIDESRGDEVVGTTGEETNLEKDDQVTQPSEGGKKVSEAISKMWNNVKDESVKAFTKVKDNIVELLFPTTSTLKFKIGEGEFSIRPDDGFENQNLRIGDRVIIIPFQPNKASKSSRNFGYAVVTPAIDPEGKKIPNSYRTVAILSDHEIDRFKEKPETADIYSSISENEQRDRGFVSILYDDVSDQNGFITTPSKIINELKEGTVAHAQTVRYFYGDQYRDMNRATMDETIEQFINNFYANHLNSFPEAQRPTELNNIRNFYRDSENARIIIPVKRDITGNRPNLKIPPELRTYIRAGRPYIMFRSYHARGSMQFIGLSRKFLNTDLHNETLAPIRDFINTAKAMKRLLESKGINKRMGYSRSLSNMLSRLANDYSKDQTQDNYKVTMTSTENNRRVSREYTFTNVEAERLYNLYAMYSEPNTQMIRAETEKDIIALTNVRKARNYVFDDGTVIYGTIDSYDPNTRTFVVRNLRAQAGEEEFLTKSGVIHHTSKSYVGRAQKALDDIFNSNGHIASKFVSTRGKTGFVTGRKETGVSTENRNYKFMALLGSKVAPIVKSTYFNVQGEVNEYYEDVIEILEDLFNFENRGELPGKRIHYKNEEDETYTSIEVKFRVPVPISARNEAGELEHNYTNSSENTSRDTTVPNSRYFESNFESMVPTRVFIDFGEIKEKEEEEVQPTITLGEEQPEEQGELIRIEEPLAPLETLTRQEIQNLPFDQIRSRLTLEQENQLNTYAIREGFDGIDHFFAVIYSNHPIEQERFRDYIIECLL